MSNKLKKKKNVTLAEQVYERLEQLLVFSKLEPGSVLTELEISQLLNVSRTPVREALKLLAVEGLVKISKSGILIPEISVVTQLKLLKLRRVVERLSLECVIENMSSEDKKELKELVSSLEEVKEDTSFLQYLRQSHHVLGKASKNEFIAASLKSTQGLSRRFWLFYAKDEDYIIAKTLHKSLLISVLELNKELALFNSSKIIDYLEEFARKRLP